MILQRMHGTQTRKRVTIANTASFIVFQILCNFSAITVAVYSILKFFYKFLVPFQITTAQLRIGSFMSLWCDAEYSIS